MGKFCTNCGNILRDGSSFCSECGTPVRLEVEKIPKTKKSGKIKKEDNEDKKTTTGRIILHRDDRFNGVAVNIDVRVNNVLYTISNGQKIIIDVTPGTYTISWKVWCRSWQTVTVEVELGKEYLLHFVPDYLLGGFKLGGAV